MDSEKTKNSTNVPTTPESSDVGAKNRKKTEPKVREPGTGYFAKGNKLGPGRPQGSRSMSTLLREALQEFGAVNRDGTKIPFDAVIIKKLIGLAASGNLKAIEMIVDRLEGKPRQNLGLDGGQDGSPLLVEISEIIAKKNGLTEKEKGQ